MKVVHICTSDFDGGAAKAAYRLHKALLEMGIDSKMLVKNKITDELYIDSIKKDKLEKFFFSKIRALFEKIILHKYRNRKNRILFSTGFFGKDISKHPYIKEADVIHLHWINGNYVSLKSLKKLGKLNKRIVWTLHDMWPFTGGCHYSFSCKNYEEKCGNCPILETNRNNDISRKIFTKKENIYRKINIKIIGCSNWISECAKNSKLLGDKEIYTLPNVLNENIFKPIDKNFARKILSLDEGKKYLCFGAMSSTSDPRKGWFYLKKSLETLKQSNSFLDNNLELIVFGSSYSKDIHELPLKVNFLGKVYDEYTLSLIYNSSDVFLAPSLEDNLPNTVLESLHCGTPVVAFNIGGMPDMITHKVNGYLAKPKDYEDMALGIEWVLKNLNKVSIDKNKFSKNFIVNQMIKIYCN